MVRTKGPITSAAASGAIAGALVASNWKGRSYMKKLTVPNNPRSAAQVGARTVIAFCSKTWNTLSTGQHDTWSNRAKQTNVSPYNAFQQENLQRWSRFEYPTCIPPGAAPLDNATIGYAAASPLQRSIRLHIQRAVAHTNWGIYFFSSPTTGFDPHPDNCITCLWWKYNAPADLYWIHANIEPGAHYYRLITFSFRGNCTETYNAEFSAFLP